MDIGPYLGTIAVDALVPNADPLTHLLTLDVHQRGAVLHGLTGPGRTAVIPAWLGVTDLRTEHRGRSGSAGGRSDGSTDWQIALMPAIPDDARAMRLTALPSPDGRHTGSGPPGVTPVAHLGEAVVLDLGGRPQEARSVPATIDRKRPVHPSPLQGVLPGRPRLVSVRRPLRVIAVSSRLDTGRSGDPYVTSIVAGDDWFELSLVWNAHQSFNRMMGSGWTAVDDLGGEYHGSPSSGAGSGDRHQLDFVFVPALDPRATRLTVTLPDVVSVPHTGTGALTATLDLGPSPCPADG